MTKPTLPELPEGMYFKVGTGTLGTYPYVSIMRKNKYWFDTKVDSAWWGGPDFKTVEEEIAALAEIMYKSLNYNASREATKAKLIGNYPPKEL